MALVRCNSFDEGVCGCFAGALQIRVPKGVSILEKCKMDAKRYQKLPTWIQQGAEMNKGPPKTHPGEQGPKSEEKG